MPTPPPPSTTQSVLVGWDDSNGCWIMEKFGGNGWGESGYMRIAYGCY